uniref:Nuclear transcription factor Y subunit C-10 n=1 Tax=Noccaea caerulescens TaxID=107243 RepID=A0A1J3E860_NOCCA
MSLHPLRSSTIVPFFAVMDNRKRSIPIPPIEPSLMRMDPVMPTLNQGWRSFPTNRERDILEHNLEAFWDRQRDDAEKSTDFHNKDHLPLARIKRVMKSDPKVKMVSSDTPVVLAKACEIFIMELTLRAWMRTQSCSRRTIRTCEISEAIRNSVVHSFLYRHVLFGSSSVSQQAEPERELHHQLFPPANAKAPIDMEQIEQDNRMADRFINIEEFETNQDNLQ